MLNWKHKILIGAIVLSVGIGWVLFTGCDGNPGTDGGGVVDMAQNQGDGSVIPDMTQQGDGSITPDMAQASCGTGLEDTADDLPQTMTLAPFACMAKAIDATCWSIGGQSTRVDNASKNSCTVLDMDTIRTHAPGRYFRCGMANDCFQDCGNPAKDCYVAHYYKLGSATSVAGCDALEIRKFAVGHVWSPTSTDYTVVSNGACF